MSHHLWPVAEDELRKRNARLAPDVEVALRDLMSRATIGSLHAGSGDSVPDDAAEAQKQALASSNTRRLVEEMAKEAAARGQALISRDDFVATRLRLCPGLFPFC